MTDQDARDLIARLRQWANHGQAWFIANDAKAAAAALESAERELAATRQELEAWRSGLRPAGSRPTDGAADGVSTLRASIPIATCANPECGEYPYYGVAPHECFYKKGPEYTVGQSTLLPRNEWPDNFVLDLEPGEDPATVRYPSACGTYYCPTCRAGMPAQGIEAGGRDPQGLGPEGPKARSATPMRSGDMAVPGETQG
jgi:hypothetical protein